MFSPAFLSLEFKKYLLHLVLNRKEGIEKTVCLTTKFFK